jgi:hypothetical protein
LKLDLSGFQNAEEHYENSDTEEISVSETNENFLIEPIKKEDTPREEQKEASEKLLETSSSDRVSPGEHEGVDFLKS